MNGRPFRFLQASDFHLEQPPLGVDQVPEHLRELFVEAAYWAAQRVFETALAEGVDALLLCGDILDPTWTGPRGPLFLVEQFRRLAERGIQVYWAGGRADPPEVWPSLVRLPENVHVFSSGRPEEFLHQRGEGQAPVRLIGSSRQRGRRLRTSHFRPDPTNLLTIAVVHGNAGPSALRRQGIHYWALGGRHDRTTPLSSPVTAHFPGTPQGRRPEESGSHGCTLVEIDDARQAHLTFVPTDVMRWQNERVMVDARTTREDLEGMLRERMQSLSEALARTDLLVSWTVTGGGPLAARIREGRLSAELLEKLRGEFGFGPPAAWSLSMVAESPEELPGEWYEQETLRGDFLRAVRHLQTNPGTPLGLEAYLPEPGENGLSGAAAIIGSRTVGEQVLRDAAMLGVDLLSGKEPQP